ncbi:hypothetical protein BJ165DRAFT_1435329 [Panaeolus papilionaceus]|nr:hypothetical protein BJ165DRAFT_1435329 [Panaeolus papilionaceus]
MENKYNKSDKPKNWPHNVDYICELRYHKSVSPGILRQIREQPSTSNLLIPAPINQTKVIIRAISDSSHPANGQFGLFAAQKIPPNSHIIDYFGEVHCDERSESVYDLSLCRLSDNISVGIDASRMGNQARFVNDYRGISKKPNAVFLDGKTSSGDYRMSVWSCKEVIKKGEEILVSYGKSWWQSRE